MFGWYVRVKPYIDTIVTHTAAINAEGELVITLAGLLAVLAVLLSKRKTPVTK